jgi:hypothetical protein
VVLSFSRDRNCPPASCLLLVGPASVPSGQEPLLALSNANFEKFEKAFDDGNNATRLVLLLSPT